MFSYKNNQRKYQLGQAITEFNVTAAFLLVPLFIMIPLLGKYIDMKHSSVQAARYMAWERTVWFEEAPENTTTASVKTKAVLERETRERFFSGVNVDELGSTQINPLWNDRGNDDDERLIIDDQDNVLISYLNGGNENVLRSDTLSNGNDFDPTNDKRALSYHFIEELSNIVGIAANAAGELISIVGRIVNSAISRINGVLPINLPTLPSGITNRPNVMDKFQFKGYYRAEVSMEPNDSLFQKVFGIAAPAITSNAAVLTDSWVVEGDKQFATYTKSFVAFAPLDPLFQTLRPVFTTNIPILGPLAPELKDLEFGYVDTKPTTDSWVKPTCSPGGLCSFE